MPPLNEMLRPRDFIGAAEAREIIDRDGNFLTRLVKRGEIRVYRLPGSYPKYHKGDLVRVAREAMGLAVPS
jgi:hypothetical protein